jgi:hypothetical protein
MKIPKQLATILTILTLLITQISGAFASAMVFSSISDTPCSMSKADHHAMHADAQMSIKPESASEHMMSDHGKTTTMDCCDSIDMNNCCEGQCACIAVAATAVFVFGSLSDDSLPNTNETFFESTPPPHSAFSALLMRPPIQSLA